MSEKVLLGYCEGNSDKIYCAEIVVTPEGCHVRFAYGRRGGTMNTGTKTSAPVPYAQAKKIFDTLVNAKLAKGYEPMGAPIKVFTSVGGDKRAPSGYKPQLLNMIEESELGQWRPGCARGGGWANQPTRSQTARHRAPGRERVADSGMGRDESFTYGRHGGGRR
jgi:predicted DNA-binding WGR domain protein